MAITPGDTGGNGGGVLGGTASSICAISPSDLVGTIGNLITRIEELEKAVSSVLGADLFTEKLSNLAQQVGWVYGVDYMGVPGWIQTEYGTLIPPEGFTLLGNGVTLSDGNTYSAVYYDENGVLQFGFPANGTAPVGVYPDAWNAAAAATAPDYFIYSQGILQVGGTPYTSEKNISMTASSGLGGNSSWSMNVTVTSPGLYAVSMTGDWTTGITGGGAAWVDGGITATAGSDVLKNHGSVRDSRVTGFAYYGGTGDPSLVAGTGSSEINLAGVFDVDAGARFDFVCNLSIGGGASNDGRNKVYASVVRLGSGAY